MNRKLRCMMEAPVPRRAPPLHGLVCAPPRVCPGRCDAHPQMRHAAVAKILLPQPGLSVERVDVAPWPAAGLPWSGSTERRATSPRPPWRGSVVQRGGVGDRGDACQPLACFRHKLAKAQPPNTRTLSVKMRANCRHDADDVGCAPA